MNDEERAKYVCPKDKENLEKKLKSGRSFGYFTLYTQREIYLLIAIVGIELTVALGAFLVMESVTNNFLTYENKLLIKQVDTYIKKDFKGMNCVEKNVFLEKYMTDKTIYGHHEMQDWLQENFNDNCNLNK